MVKKKDRKNGRMEKIIHPRKKEEYLKPELIIYGNMEKLTEGAGTHGNDGGAGYKN